MEAAEREASTRPGAPASGRRPPSPRTGRKDAVARTAEPGFDFVDDLDFLSSRWAGAVWRLADALACIWFCLRLCLQVPLTRRVVFTRQRRLV